MEALEGSEELVRVLHVEARAVVPDVEGGGAAVGLPANLDAGIFSLARELPRVAHEVLEHDGQQMRIGLRDEPRLDLHLDLPRRLPAPQLRRHLAGDVAEVRALADQLAPAHPGQAQQVVDELRHAQRARPHPLEVVAAAVVEAGSIVGEHRLAEAVDGPQGGPEVVRYRVREGFQLLVRRRQVAGAGVHATLEVGAGFLEIGVLPLDLVQHLVEGPDQEADLVAAFRRGPHRVVLLRRYGARRVGQPNDGPGDGLRHEPRDAQREPEA